MIGPACQLGGAKCRQQLARHCAMSLPEHPPPDVLSSQSLLSSDDRATEGLVACACKNNHSHSAYRGFAWYSSVMQVLVAFATLAASTVYLIACFRLANL